MAVDMMDAIEEFLAKGLPGVKVSLGKGKVVAKSESSSTTKASVDRNWVADPLLPDGWKVAIEIGFDLACNTFCSGLPHRRSNMAAYPDFPL